MDNFLFLILSLRWQDIVDIGLVSYILLRFYILFRGTNAFRVLIGMTVLWIFHQVAVSLGLVVTSRGGQWVVTLGAFIIIVIFRNEIRNVLLARNLKSILWDFSSKTAITAIETIVQSVHEMAQAKCGALIVLPGKEDLEEVVQGGIPWRGAISKEMILSIFCRTIRCTTGLLLFRAIKSTRSRLSCRCPGATTFLLTTVLATGRPSGWRKPPTPWSLLYQRKEGI